MPRIQNSIIIHAPAAEVFAITNDIEHWPELFNEYQSSQVLSRQDSGRYTKLIFQLSNAHSTWQSWRLMDHEDLVAIAERIDPLYPFAFMHLRWNYTPHDEGTLMEWTQDFELAPSFPEPLDVVVERMNAHTRENQGHIKAFIEQSVSVRP